MSRLRFVAAEGVRLLADNCYKRFVSYNLEMPVNYLNRAGKSGIQATVPDLSSFIQAPRSGVAAATVWKPRGVLREQQFQSLPL